VPLLTSETVEQLAKSPWFPSLHDQEIALIRGVGAASSGPGESIQIVDNIIQFAIGARSPKTVSALLDHLGHKGLARSQKSNHMSGPTMYQVSLTFDGWLQYEDLLKGKSTGRTAFMAMPFGKPELEQHWLPALRVAVAETGFALKRVDDEPKPGLIDVRMRVQITQARFLIVELTNANSGAYWEAGFAEGQGKPVIYLCREGEKVHFDVDHSLRIIWNPEDFQPALGLLKATIRNELPDAATE
jgi:hypothetical protein